MKGRGFLLYCAVSFLVFCSNQLNGQYADLGTGKLKNQLWWFDWSGFTLQEGASRTFTTDDGLTVQIKFSGVSGQQLFPDRMNTWQGALLHYLYDFSNTAIQPALYYINPYYGFTSKFNMQVTATRNGLPTPFKFIAADAEASDSSLEFTNLNTDGSSWSTVDFFRNSNQTSNPLKGCGTNSVIMGNTYFDGAVTGTGQIPVLATDASLNGILNVGVILNENAPQGGGMGMAFAVMEPVDRGHLSASYGYAYHAINYDVLNSCNYNPPYPSLAQNYNITLGSIPPSAIGSDTTYLNTPDPDDDGVQNFPLYDGSGKYSIKIKLNNVSGNPAFLSSWFDFNNDGIFESNEMALNTVAINDTLAVVNWSGIPQNLPSSKLAFRFRLSSDQSAVLSASGFAKDGEVEDYRQQVIMGSGTTCGNTWMYNPDQLSGIRIGNLNVTGNQITVEALFNRIAVSPLNDSAYSGVGEIVSKHSDPTNVNYLLRGDRAQITTDLSGHVAAIANCSMQLGKTYHVAMVYDGQTLRYYRNGFLMASSPCTGNMIQNNFQTMIGNYTYIPGKYYNTTLGYISEVRIWNVARTQEQLKTSMNVPLPNPTTQTGLLAYYSFDDLKNKQGNSAWDGSLYGNTTIQNGNPSCNKYIADSCSQILIPVLYKIKDTAICLGQSVNLNVTVNNVIDYTWSPSNSLSNPAIPNPVATPLTSTVYYIKAHAYASDGSVASLSDSIQVTILPLPVINTVSDTAICTGDTLILKTGGALQYSWLPSAGLSNNTIANPLATPKSSTRYFVTGTDINGCINKDSVQINVMPIPSVSITNDTSICIGHSIPLFSAGGVNYEWTPLAGLSGISIPNPIVTPAVTTRYKVNVTGNNKCIATDSVLITVIPLPVFSLQPVTYTLCLGDTVTLNATGGDQYTWLNSISTAFNHNAHIIVQPATTTTYSLAISNKVCGITDTLQSVVQVNPLPVISISKSNDIDCNTGSAQLKAEGGVGYTWSPGNGLSDSTIADPVVQVLQSTLYSVTVFSDKSCAAKDTISVLVFKNSNNPFLVANAFTPNGDGLNDCFGIKFWGVINSFEFSIYNRWGERIFFTTNASDCWDGTYKGLKQPIGNYIYKIQANTLCGDVNRSGTVVLLR